MPNGLTRLLVIQSFQCSNIGAAVITIVLFVYQPAQTWPGLAIVGIGIPVYFIWRKLGTPMPDEE